MFPSLLYIITCFLSLRLLSRHRNHSLQVQPIHWAQIRHRLFNHPQVQTFADLPEPQRLALTHLGRMNENNPEAIDKILKTVGWGRVDSISSLSETTYPELKQQLGTDEDTRAQLLFLPGPNGTPDQVLLACDAAISEENVKIIVVPGFGFHSEIVLDDESGDHPMTLTASALENIKPALASLTHVMAGSCTKFSWEAATVGDNNHDFTPFPYNTEETDEQLPPVDSLELKNFDIYSSVQGSIVKKCNKITLYQGRLDGGGASFVDAVLEKDVEVTFKETFSLDYQNVIRLLTHVCGPLPFGSKLILTEGAFTDLLTMEDTDSDSMPAREHLVSLLADHVTNGSCASRFIVKPEELSGSHEKEELQNLLHEAHERAYARACIDRKVAICNKIKMHQLPFTVKPLPAKPVPAEGSASGVKESASDKIVNGLKALFEARHAEVLAEIDQNKKQPEAAIAASKL